ncbi:MAG: radical SAM protein, partial [Phycisphaerae bacterium]
MKIGFLAMSGIRAHDAKLLELGLTLPGFVERSKTIAQLPSLGLLYLAAVTPPGHDLAYYEAERDGAEPAEVYTCDLVAISTFSAQVFEAYAIAGRLRAAGVKVAMGGLHVSVLPEEAARHANYVIVGEGENVWANIVAQAAGNGGLSPSRISDCGSRIEQADGLPVLANPQFEIRNPKSIIVRSREFPPIDVSRLPVPRYDLLGDRPYNRFTVQSSRGCPWRCDFCASTVMLAEKYRKRPVADVIRDIRAIMAVRDRPFIEFADDNTFVDKAWGKELCRQLIPLRLKWFTETDVTVADDPELLELMHEAGCRQVLIGLESPTQGALKGIEM